MGPTVGGGQVDLRGVPAQKVLDMTGCLMDPKQTLGFVTALNLDKHLLFGYVWPRQITPG